MSLITQLTSSDIPIVIILLGALFLYFGFIIGNTKVWKHDKIEYYIQGLFFFVFYIFIPFIACFFLRGQLNVWSFLLNPIYIQVVVLFQVAVLLFQFVVFCFLSGTINAQKIRRYEFVDTGRNEFEKIINELPFIGKIIRSNENLYDKFEKFFELIAYKIPIKMENQYILFIFSFLTILSNFILYDSPTTSTYASGELLIFGFSMVLSFIILTYAALAYGFSDVGYRFVKVYLVDSEPIQGKMLHYGELIIILKNGYLFSWDSIPGSGNDGLIEFLNRYFGIEGVKTANIEKSDNGRTIKLSTEKNSLSLMLNNENTKVNLKIDDGRNDEFMVKTEKSKLNIYENKQILINKDKINYIENSFFE